MSTLKLVPEDREENQSTLRPMEDASTKRVSTLRPMGTTEATYEDYTLPEKPTLLDYGESFGRRMAVGLHEMVTPSQSAIDSPTTTLSYAPGAFWSAAAIPAVIDSFFSGGENAKLPSDMTEDNSLWEKFLAESWESLHHANTNYQEAKDYAGVTDDASNLFEVAGEVVGSLLIPSPTKWLDIPGKAAKLLSNTPKLGRALGGIAEVGAEVMLPLRGTTTKLGLAAEAGIPTVAVDYLLHDQDEYDSWIWDKSNATDFTNVQKIQAQQYPTRHEQSESLLRPMNVQQDLNDDDLHGIVPDDTNRMHQLFEYVEDNYADELSFSAKAGLGVAAGIGLFAGKSMYTAQAAKKYRQTMSDASEFLADPSVRREAPIGTIDQPVAELDSSFKVDPEGLLGSLEIKNAQLTNSIQPIMNRVDELVMAGRITHQRGETVKAHVTTRFETRATGTKIAMAGKSGHLYGTDIQTHPLANLLERDSRFTPQENAMLNDILILEDRIDVVKRGKLGKTWEGMDEHALKIKADQMRVSNPKVSLLADDIHEFTRDIGKYLGEMGIITSGEARNWAFNSRHYVPTSLGTSEGLLADAMRARTAFDNPHSIKPGEFAAPVELLPQYFARMMKLALQNDMRRQLVDLFEGDAFITRGGKPLVERTLYKEKNINDPKIIHVIRGGRKEQYKVNDAYFAQIMHDSPRYGDEYIGRLGKFMIGSAKLSRAFITGPVAPWFAPFGAAYDSLMGHLTRETGVKNGRIGDMLYALTGIDSARILSPEFLLKPIVGTIRNWYADFTSQTARKLHGDLYNNSGMVNLIGKEATAALSEVAHRAFLNSSKGLYEARGGGTSPIWGASVSELPDMVDRLSGKFVRTMTPKMRMSAETGARFYMSLLDGIHSSARTDSFAQGLKRQWTLETVTTRMPDGRSKKVRVLRNKIEEDPYMDILAKQVREMGGDLGRKGGIPNTPWAGMYRKYLASTMFANVGIQSVMRIGKAITDNPGKFLGAVTAVTTSAVAIQMQELIGNENAQRAYGMLTPRQRSRFVHLYDENGEPWLSYPIPNELRWFWGPIIEGVVHLSGLGDLPNYEANYQGREAWLSVYDELLPEVVPPGAVAILWGVSGTLKALGVGNSPIQNVTSIPERYYKGKDTSADTTAGIRAITDLYTHQVGTNILEGILSSYYHLADGDDKTKFTRALNSLGEGIVSSLQVQNKVTSHLFPAAERVPMSLSIADPISDYVYGVNKKVKHYTEKVSDHGSKPTTTVEKPTFKEQFIDEVRRAELNDPELPEIMKAVDQYNMLLGPGFARLSSLTEARKVKEDAHTTYSNQQARTKYLNLNVSQKKAILGQMYDNLKTIEARTSQRLGRPWTFEDISLPRQTTAEDSIPNPNTQSLLLPY